MIFCQNIFQWLFLELFKFWQRYSKVFGKVAAIYRSNKGFLHHISSLQMFFVLRQVLKNLSQSLRCSEKYVLEIGVLQFFRFTCHQDLWKIYVKKSVLIKLQNCYFWKSPCVFLLLKCHAFLLIFSLEFPFKKTTGVFSDKNKQKQPLDLFRQKMCSGKYSEQLSQKMAGEVYSQNHSKVHPMKLIFS